MNAIAGTGSDAEAVKFHPDGASVVLSDEDAARSGVYRLLSGLLTAPPSDAVLADLRDLRGDTTTPIGAAISEVAQSAGRASTDTVAEEYQDLFIGLGRGELLPYESYYLTGFLHEKPLARLRQDMQRLGISADPSVSEPEDHIASVLEIMAGLVDRTIGSGDAADEARFFETHIATWGPVFFADLEKATSARFYRPVAVLGREFLIIETEAFRMG